MHFTDQFIACTDKRSVRKRAGSGSKSSGASKKVKRQVTVATFEKWKREYNREHQRLSWLQCDKDKHDKTLVSTSWCELSRHHEGRIQSMRNLSAAWVTGSTNDRASNSVDHARSEQHAASMAYTRSNRSKAHGIPVEMYSPIARSLLVLDDCDKRKIGPKFEICCVLAREGLAFLKYPAFRELPECQEVELGSTYKRSDCAKVFTHFIAEAQRKLLLDSLSGVRFFSMAQWMRGRKSKSWCLSLFVLRMTKRNRSDHS